MGGTGTADFVGRRGELHALDAALNHARDGHPTLALVEGIGGIGKTALLRRFIRDAADICPLWASGDEGETDLDFGVIERADERNRPLDLN